MKTTLTLLFLAALAAAAGPLRADDAASQIAFSDPARPGTLRIRIGHGDITIRGADVKDISVRSDSAPADPTPRSDGMRVLSATPGFSLGEKDNVVTLDYGAEGSGGGSADFEITVPRSTSVIVASTTHGDLVCSGLSGNIDVRSMSGDVRLTDISGGALVETMGGDIDVSVKALAAGKPLSFTSMRGEISIRVPAETKANVRFRTHRGVILTNFDEKALVTRTEYVRPGRAPKQAAGAPAAPAPPTAAAPPGDEGMDWHVEVSETARDAAREAAEAMREAAEAVREGLAEAHVELTGEFHPLPPMTGGKVVTGVLNGGGDEIQASTLNGDIQLKKIP